MKQVRFKGLSTTPDEGTLPEGVTVEVNFLTLVINVPDGVEEVEYILDSDEYGNIEVVGGGTATRTEKGKGIAYKYVNGEQKMEMERRERERREREMERRERGLERLGSDGYREHSATPKVVSTDDTVMDEPTKAPESSNTAAIVIFLSFIPFCLWTLYPLLSEYCLI